MMVKVMIKTILSRSWVYVAGLIALLPLVNFAHAQDLIFVNPADRGDSRTSLFNPAVAAQQDRLFSLGSRALYVGDVSNGMDLTHSYFNLTLSRRTLLGLGGFAYGVQGQILHMPEYMVMATNGLFAKQLSDKIALGVNLGITFRGFDFTALKATHPDDPEFGDLAKAVPELGFGVIAVPSRFLTLGFSMNHLTHSNLSFGKTDVVALPRAINAGMAVGYGNFRALFSLAYNERDFLPRFAVESFRERLGYMRVSLGREMAMLDTKLNVMEGIALNFRYNYPLNELALATSGSPELGLEFNFDKNTSLYAMEWMETEVPRRPSISLAHAFLAESVYDTLFITKKIIRRTIDPSLHEQLKDLPRAIFFAADQDSVLPLAPDKIFLSEEELQKRPKIGARTLLHKIEAAEQLPGSKLYVPRDSLSILKEMTKTNHKQEYLDAFRTLAERIKVAPKVQGNFVTPRDAKRAHLLLRFLNLYTPLTDDIKVTVADSVNSLRLSQETEKLGSLKVAPLDSFVALRAYSKARGRVMVNAPVDTFRLSLNMTETKRWGPVSGELIVKNEQDKIVFRATDIVTRSKNDDASQIRQSLDWDWKLEDQSYLPTGTYFYYIEWLSADGKRYRSPENRIRVERKLITSSITLSKKMPEPNPDASIKALIQMR